jgi:hypothetical protein
VTPRDEEMRPSGTLTSPTTGSLEAMMRETEREEQYAAARRIPKDVTLQLPDQAVTYAPKALAADQTSANGSQPSAAQVVAVSQPSSATPAQTQTAALTAPAKQEQAAAAPADSAVPQPKTLAFAPSVAPSSTQKLDVAGAVKSIVSPTTGVSGTAAAAKQDVTLSPVVEELAPKSEKTDTSSNEPAAGLVELSLSPEQGVMRVGEKRQLALAVRTGASLGLAVVTLRFDPHVLKINSVTAGGIFANAKTAPSLTQSIDPSGMLLVSLAPAAGSPITGEGVLLNLEVEAIAGGDSLLAFDLANVHLVTSDGRGILLQVEPVKLTVK